MWKICRIFRGKRKKDEGKINIGAVLRVTPIKDVKTMIQAFGFAKEKDDRLKLWIMGPWEEDREYAEECFQLVSDMEIPDVVLPEESISAIILEEWM